MPAAMVPPAVNNHDCASEFRTFSQWLAEAQRIMRCRPRVGATATVPVDQLGGLDVERSRAWATLAQHAREVELVVAAVSRWRADTVAGFQSDLRCACGRIRTCGLLLRALSTTGH
jgi:hypothetical protein